MSSVKEVSAPAWAIRGSATNVPRPCSRYTAPSAVSRSISPRTVMRASPYRSASSRSDGSAEPAGSEASSSSRIARSAWPFGVPRGSRAGSAAPSDAARSAIGSERRRGGEPARELFRVRDGGAHDDGEGARPERGPDLLLRAVAPLGQDGDADLLGELRDQGRVRAGDVLRAGVAGQGRG